MARDTRFIEGVARYATGRINYRAEERKAKETNEGKGSPNPRTADHRDLFSARCFKGGGQGGQSHDAIGQLWLVDQLEVDGFESRELMRFGREWWDARESYFKAVGFQSGNMERASRTSGGSAATTRTESRFLKYDRLLNGAETFDRACLEDMMTRSLDGQIAQWVSRIVDTEILKKRIRLPVALLATPDDYAFLVAAKRALVCLAGKKMEREAA